MTIKGVGRTIEDLCWGEDHAEMGGRPKAAVTIVSMDGFTVTGSWRLDLNMTEWLYDPQQMLWVRCSTISRFKAVPPPT